MKAKGICLNCGIITTAEYAHPTLGKVCAVCLHPKRSRRTRRTGKEAKRRRKTKPYLVSTRLLKIAERDGWVCHLCGGAVPRSGWLAGDPSRPTLDHLIPRSLGGGRSAANLRLAHADCNNRRGNLPLDRPTIAV